MTDEEKICSFMEEKPDRGPDWHGVWNTGWWVYAVGSWIPAGLTLDRLRHVEERLTDMQCATYTSELLKFCRDREPNNPCRGWLWHASAEQKIKALGNVLP